ncbi:hypothetical protein [Burkholderia aenigmatica]|uniref:hypothetical protein n=1 Tax=Burkholderia aenigmatica TaxID=2015348 RepID=UPI002652FCAC|nr:hypothetical protein [Burkholderia aenigmatica]MDN7880104.1 hypothetical protein [Burkholderia aenigmatica]
MNYTGDTEATEKLGEAIDAFASSGPLQHSYVLRIPNKNGPSHIQAVLFTETEQLGDTMCKYLETDRVRSRAQAMALCGTFMIVAPFLNRPLPAWDALPSGADWERFIVSWIGVVLLAAALAFMVPLPSRWRRKGPRMNRRQGSTVNSKPKI